MTDFRALYNKHLNEFTTEEEAAWKKDSDVEHMQQTEMKIEIRSLREKIRDMSRGQTIVVTYLVMFAVAILAPFVWYAICKILGI